MFQVADLKNKLETEKGKDAYPKNNVRLIYAGKYKYTYPNTSFAQSETQMLNFH